MSTSRWSAALVGLIACSLSSCGGPKADDQGSSPVSKAKNGEAADPHASSADTGQAQEAATGETPAPGSSPSPSSDDAAATPASPSAPQGPQSPGPSSLPPQAPACVAPEGVASDPRSIEDAIALINALPMPVTLKCYLEALRRPLFLNATSSELSVQPAASEQSPRMFLFSGPLVSSFVPEGEGAQLLELSVLLSDQTSVKGELAFPVAAALPLDAAYKRIERNDGSGTRCAGCHFSEVQASSPGAYSSTALRPLDSSDIPLEYLSPESAACANATSERCKILRAVFEHGEVKPKAFPDEMPTLF